jgi:hypothetical protein
MPVRTTVYLDAAVLELVRRHVPERGLSRFINRALAEKAEALERERIEELMIEGYKASWTEQGDVDRDWRAVETEGWPE